MNDAETLKHRVEECIEKGSTTLDLSRICFEYELRFAIEEKTHRLFPNLRNLAGHIGGRYLVEKLPQCTNLEAVIFRFCGLDGQDMPHITEALSQCPKITTLDFSHNNIGNGWQGFTCLAKILPHLPDLTTLGLANIDMSLSYFRQHLAGALLQCEKLSTLNMGHMGAHPHSADDLSWFATFLPKLTELTSLDLIAFNLFGDSDLQCIVDCLPDCLKLEDIDLSFNQLGYRANGFQIVVDALTRCHALTHIDLRRNQFDATHQAPLANALSPCGNPMFKVESNSFDMRVLSVTEKPENETPVESSTELPQNEI